MDMQVEKWLVDQNEKSPNYVQTPIKFAIFIFAQIPLEKSMNLSLLPTMGIN